MSEKTEVYDVTTTEPPGGTPPTAPVDVVEEPRVTVYRPQFNENLLKPGTAILLRAGKRESWKDYKHEVNAIVTDVGPLVLTVVYYGPALDRYNNHHDGDMDERRHVINIHEITNETHQIEILREAKA